MFWGHCIAKDRADRELWRVELRRGDSFPADLMHRVMSDPNLASFHIGTRRTLMPWLWQCKDADAPENWPSTLAAKHR